MRYLWGCGSNDSHDVRVEGDGGVVIVERIVDDEPVWVLLAHDLQHRQMSTPPKLMLSLTSGSTGAAMLLTRFEVLKLSWS